MKKAAMSTIGEPLQHNFGYVARSGQERGGYSGDISFPGKMVAMFDSFGKVALLRYCGSKTNFDAKKFEWETICICRLHVHRINCDCGCTDYLEQSTSNWATRTICIGATSLALSNSDVLQLLSPFNR